MNLDGIGVTGDRFIHAVVDDLVGEVVGAVGVGEHPRPFAHRLQAGEYFNGRSVIAMGH